MNDAPVAAYLDVVAALMAWQEQIDALTLREQTLRAEVRCTRRRRRRYEAACAGVREAMELEASYGQMGLSL